jgi:hypothetical protein
VTQLRREESIDRTEISVVAADLIGYIEANEKDDPILLKEKDKKRRGASNIFGRLCSKD